MSDTDTPFQRLLKRSRELEAEKEQLIARNSALELQVVESDYINELQLARGERDTALARVAKLESAFSRAKITAAFFAHSTNHERMMPDPILKGDGWEVYAGDTCGADGATRGTTFFWRSRMVIGTSGRGTTDAEAGRNTASRLRDLARAATEAAEALENGE